jgi:hypothetical protein
MLATKAALEQLLRDRRLQADAPPLRGEERFSPFSSGICTVDEMLDGGFPRGRVSEVHGPSSSGRTGLALAVLARAIHGGSLAAWVDPFDRLDPASAAAAGVLLDRLLWVRGEPRSDALPRSLAAVTTLLPSGLFDLVVLDLAAAPAADLRRLPGSTWLRLQRTVEPSSTTLLLLGQEHISHGPWGVSLALSSRGARWCGGSGPGRLLRGLGAEARAGCHGLSRAPFELRALA